MLQPMRWWRLCRGCEVVFVPKLNATSAIANRVRLGLETAPPVPSGLEKKQSVETRRGFFLSYSCNPLPMPIMRIMTNKRARLLSSIM